MSGSDGEDSQRESTREENVVLMGDVLTKKQIDEDSHDAFNTPESDFASEEDNEVEDAEKEAVAPSVMTRSVSVTDMAIDENAVDIISVDLKNLKNVEQFCVQTSPEIVFDNFCTSTTTVHNASSQHNKELCTCDTYKAKREMFREELQKAMKFQNLWNELRQHIRNAFNSALEHSRESDLVQSQLNMLSLVDMHDTVIQLCKRDPHQLFMRLVSQAQEFVVEVKVRLLALLHDRSINNLAEIFLTGLLDDYDALISTASQISELVKPLKEHLCKLNLTWDCFIKKLYQIYVYNDPLVQNNLPPFIGQLRKLLPLKGSEYQGLVHRYLSFDDEMTKIGDMWPETEPWMDKYNAEQAVRMTRLRQIREAWEIFTATRKLMEQRILMKTSDNASELQEIDGQLSALVEQGKMDICDADSRSPSPISDFNLDSLSMPPSIEIVQILLDDWNNAQHQKLADIVGPLTVRDMIANENDPDSLAYAHASNHLAQFAIRTVRGHGEGICMENNIAEEEKDCECHVCTKPLVSSMEDKSTEDVELQKDNMDFFSPVINKFIEEAVNDIIDNPDNTTMQILQKYDKMEEEDMRNEENCTILNSAIENMNLNTSVSQPCLCVYQHAREIAERKKEIVENPPCPCLLSSKKKWNTCPCLTKVETDRIMTHTLSKPTSFDPVAVNTNQEPAKIAAKAGSTQSIQTQTRHSTTQTPNSNHNHIAHAGVTNTAHPHTHGSLTEYGKSATPTPKPHIHNNHTPHSCHKQANVEHIKRVSCNDLSSADGDCSDSGSSQEDSCSTSSSAQRDSNRHCDCRYCEVFGHGVPSVTPVSRNYNEMRERLRQILTKKKAKKCKATCSPPKDPLEVLPSNTNLESKTVQNNLAPRSNTPVSTTSTIHQDQQDQRNLEELLEFIEGNQNGKKDNNKKAEKKARQKQRKLEEKLKRDKQEAERQKLIELQKKTPEVTITVVDPQKPVSRRLLPQCNLPEVSILPTSPPTILPITKQLNNKKKDKQEVYSNSNSSNTSNNCNSSNSSNNKTKISSTNSNLKNKSISSTADKLDKSSNSNQMNKITLKSDKTEFSSKTNKGLTNTNISIKDNVNNDVDKLTNIDLIDKKLSKKERKKLKKEMMKRNDEDRASDRCEKPVQTESQPQIVTIKRIMESNSAEPTVTITLKGQTPAEDKVLFTLVNGQTKEASPSKSDQEQCQTSNGKKKKGKASNGSSVNQGNKLQQSSSTKQQQQIKICDVKNLKQQTTSEKTKNTKQVDEKKAQQQSTNETRNAKNKKDKKNSENKENVSQQQNAINKGKNQQQNVSNKKQSKVNNTSSQTSEFQKSNNSHETVKKIKGQQQEKTNQLVSNKNNKTATNNNVNKSSRNEQQKTQSKAVQSTAKQRSCSEAQTNSNDRINSSLSNQFRDIGANSKINIENLKLPPGITITKVDAPAKQLPIRSTPMPKPVNPPKQTTIIAAPMSGVQSSYASPQAGGNVIVVDTGKLKQDLLPKSAEKDPLKEPHQLQTTVSKKKKKKNKNSLNSNNSSHLVQSQNNDSVSNHIDEPARILHNPGTNMVTIRNPAFGPMKVPPTQQAAIIKVSENGMVTIRSPALQQAINAGLTTPPKPDYIVKGDLSTNRATMDSVNTSMKHTNGIIPSSLAELRSRLPPDCTALTGLANIQISKVTNGQPIPENGINLKGTSVTLTKVRTTDTNMEDVQQAKTAVREAISASIATSTSSKSKKKKKRGNCTRKCGDDWNLVESVFTPKDIDLEDGEMDDAERELEAFKRFCLQSVPPPRKEKVNLNIKDIVLKKKSSSSATAAVIAAN